MWYLKSSFKWWGIVILVKKIINDCKCLVIYIIIHLVVCHANNKDLSKQGLAFSLISCLIFSPVLHLLLIYHWPHSFCQRPAMPCSLASSDCFEYPQIQIHQGTHTHTAKELRKLCFTPYENILTHNKTKVSPKGVGRGDLSYASIHPPLPCYKPNSW